MGTIPLGGGPLTRNTGYINYIDIKDEFGANAFVDSVFYEQQGFEDIDYFSLAIKKEDLLSKRFRKNC